MTSPRRTGIPKSIGGRASETRPGSLYCPDAGDFVWLDFDPIKGHEQRGRRPALVLSPRSYNARVGLCLACPVTSRAKGYPFEVPTSGRVTGVVLADQPRSLAWGERQPALIERANARVLDDVREKLLVLLGS